MISTHSKLLTHYRNGTGFIESNNAMTFWQTSIVYHDHRDENPLSERYEIVCL